jgi:hypothetical protein
MSRISELSENRVGAESRVFVYGFDAAGFHAHHEPVSLAGVGRIQFIDFYDSTTLEAADGIIIPQGIFEEIKSRPSRFGRERFVDRLIDCSNSRSSDCSIQKRPHCKDTPLGG